MKANILGIARNWLVVTVLGLPLISPLFRWASVSCTHDGHLHYHRVAALRYAWENGLFLSRWLPDLAFGYGYPFFVYREAAPLYLTLLPHLLGLSLPAAVNLFYMLCILAAGWFMFLWVRDIFGPAAGLVAAVAYMAAPYQLIDALIRGNQPETLALPLFPLLCWAGRRFLINGTAVPFLISVIGLAFLAFSHNISLLLFTPILLIYLLLVGWLNRLPMKTGGRRLALIFGLGLGLSAFYVGPALLELDEITISQSVTTRNNDFRFNFATLDEIFAPVSPADPSLLNRPLLIRLGWIPSLLAVAGVFLTQGRRGAEAAKVAGQRTQEQRGHVLMMAVAAVGLLLMSLAISRPLWEHLPLIEFVQFPWRFVGRAALPMAFLAGVPFAVLTQRRKGHKETEAKMQRAWVLPLAVGAAVLLLLVESFPYLYPHYCLEETFPTIQTVHVYEHRTGLVGVDPEGSYFPITVQQRPQGSPLEADYQAGRMPERFDRSRLPEGTVVDSITYRPTSAAITLTTSEPFQARYLTFAFPGWTAEVDGEPVPITPDAPEGLITFPVPAGRHTLEIRWQMTPLRTIMMAITLLCLAGTVVVTLRLRPVPQFAKLRYGGQFAKLPYKTLLITGLLFLALKLLLIDRVETPIRREAGPVVDNIIVLQANELQLAGYNLPAESVAAGETFDIDLAWQTLSQPAVNYQSNVWLVDSEGQVWSEKETYRPRLYETTSPTSFWVGGQWAWDSREVQVLPGTPPGDYDIVLTLFHLADLQPVTLLQPDGSVRGPTAVIGQITVIAPSQPPDFNPQFAIEAETAGLRLLGFNQDRVEAAPGEQLLLTLFWQKAAETQSGSQQDTLQLSLLNEAGQVVQSWTIAPVSADYPPTAWQPGERLRGQHGLRLAAGLESGSYQFRLEEIELGTLLVTAPERVFSPPPFETAVGANFGDQVELVGYTVETAGESLSVTLVWQALAEMPTSYRVFVHLVNESGQIIAQADGEPDAWTRPTTGWAVGEYIVDGYLLPVPESEEGEVIMLRIGLYDPDTGLRLLAGSADFIILRPGG